MRVKAREEIFPSFTNCILMDTISKMIDGEYASGNYWLGILDTPRNNIEKYILDCYDFFFDTQPVGFEWWFHRIKNDHDFLPAHFDCDETKRIDTGKIVTPSLSTVTYLTLSTSPTIISNIELVGDTEDQHEPEYPTELVYSFPGPGKFIEFDSKYLHGFGAAEAGRTTLMFNFWDYKPEGLLTCKYHEELKEIQFYKCEQKDPDIYEGRLGKTGIEYFGKERKIINYPTDGKYHDTFLVRA